MLFLEKNDPFHDQEREVQPSTETSNNTLTLRYGAPASMEHLEVEDVWGDGRLVGFWLGLLGRFPVSVYGFFGGVPGKKQIERQSWEVLFSKSEDENGTRQKMAM